MKLLYFKNLTYVRPACKFHPKINMSIMTNTVISLADTTTTTTTTVAAGL